MSKLLTADEVDQAFALYTDHSDGACALRDQAKAAIELQHRLDQALDRILGMATPPPKPAPAVIEDCQYCGGPLPCKRWACNN